MELRLMIADLQTKLVEVQLERDALRNARYEGRDRCVVECGYMDCERLLGENFALRNEGNETMACWFRKRLSLEP